METITALYYFNIAWGVGKTLGIITLFYLTVMLMLKTLHLLKLKILHLEQNMDKDDD